MILITYTRIEFGKLTQHHIEISRDKLDITVVGIIANGGENIQVREAVTI